MMNSLNNNFHRDMFTPFVKSSLVMIQKQQQKKKKRRKKKRRR